MTSFDIGPSCPSIRLVEVRETCRFIPTFDNSILLSLELQQCIARSCNDFIKTENEDSFDKQISYNTVQKIKHFFSSSYSS